MEIMQTFLIQNQTRDTLRKLVAAWYKVNEEKTVIVSEITFYDPIQENYKTQINFYN
jgi:hypothetical protein